MAENQTSFGMDHFFRLTSTVLDISRLDPNFTNQFRHPSRPYFDKPSWFIMAGHFLERGLSGIKFSCRDFLFHFYPFLVLAEHVFFTTTIFSDHGWSPPTLREIYLHEIELIFTFTLTQPDLFWQNPWTKNIRQEHTTRKNQWDEQTISIQVRPRRCFLVAPFLFVGFRGILHPTGLDSLCV